jgi:hypothetical protein
MLVRHILPGPQWRAVTYFGEYYHETSPLRPSQNNRAPCHR